MTQRDSRLQLPARAPTYSTTINSFLCDETLRWHLLSQKLHNHPISAEKRIISAYTDRIVQLPLLCILFQSTFLIEKPKSLESFCTVFAAPFSSPQHDDNAVPNHDTSGCVCALFNTAFIVEDCFVKCALHNICILILLITISLDVYAHKKLYICIFRQQARRSIRCSGWVYVA